MAGYYELKKNDKGQYRFVLKAGNHEVILQSETYESKAGAENGIASVQKNGPMAERFAKATAKNGKFYFNLKAGNGQIIGTSEMYDSEAGCANGMASVQSNAASSTIKEA